MSNPTMDEGRVIYIVIVFIGFNCEYFYLILDVTWFVNYYDNPTFAGAYNLEIKKRHRSKNATPCNFSGPIL